MRVDLGGTERLVSQQLLHGTKVGTIVEKMRGEAVPNGVRTDFGVETDGTEVLRDLASNGAAAQSTTMLVDEER